MVGISGGSFDKSAADFNGGRWRGRLRLPSPFGRGLDVIVSVSVTTIEAICPQVLFKRSKPGTAGSVRSHLHEKSCNQLIQIQIQDNNVINLFTFESAGIVHLALDAEAPVQVLGGRDHDVALVLGDARGVTRSHGPACRGRRSSAVGLH